MPSWSSLPTEFRENVVRKLDFRTRFRFRHVSKTDKELVDSVPLYIYLVALSVKNENEAKVSFYTGIEKWIEVEYVHDGKSKTNVKVTEISHSKVTQHGAIRRLDSPSAPMLALAAFRNAAMNPKTLSGGIELNSTNYIEFQSTQDAETFFGDRKFRTNIFYKTHKDCFDLIIRVDPAEVIEIRSKYPSKEGQNPDDFFMITRTKRVKAIIEKSDLGKWPKDKPIRWHQGYIFYVGGEDSEKLQSSGDLAQFSGKYSEKNDEYTFKNTQYCGHFCCMTFFWSKTAVRIEEPKKCSMRWVCPNHGNPFDNWYNARNRMIDYNPQKLKSAFKSDYFHEIIYPVVNGKCQMQELLNKWSSLYDKFYGKKRKSEESEVLVKQKMNVEAEKEAASAQIEKKSTRKSVKINAAKAVKPPKEEKSRFYLKPRFLVAGISVGAIFLTLVIVALCLVL